MLFQLVIRDGWGHAGPRSEHGKARPRGPTKAYIFWYVAGIADGDGTPPGEAYGTGIR